LDGREEAVVGIDASWTDESQRELDGVRDVGNFLSRHLETTTLQHTQCLQFIDPYGDAVFNQRQISVLAGELEATIPSTSDEAVIGHLRSVLRLIKKAHNQVHTYIWFIGD
jgi:hypothetical protein